MPADFSYDPVTALDEAKATGEAAAIFADIRETMSLPLVTSIWRGLAGMDDSLPRVWAATKPLFLSGLPEAALTRALSDALLPRPEPLVPVQLSCIGLDGEDVQAIRTILAAYNRSNGMNLMALAALMSAPAQTRSAPAAAPPPSPKWPPLRPLAAREAIADDVWEMVRHVNSFGAPGQDSAVATLWRHLAHWPALLALVCSAFTPLQSRGEIQAASARLAALALAEGARMAHLRPARLDFPPLAIATIRNYVKDPMQVCRMVVLGHALEQWLAP